MDIDKFAEEMLISRTDGILTDYCLEHWDDMLKIMPNKNNDMDNLIELASNINFQRVGALNDYYDFVEKLKKQQKYEKGGNYDYE
ncbi:hypothetical protein [Vagococcus fluvialis]|uniref:hypothetical protein n=1 Tax=Vagococcus fluvialis TaxID=2738 RepID=UPI001D0BE44B|nr:hypothetical protein [Vagococcus fluvialis]UDM75062.1 hypothetical protein K5K99_05670 [Vagococcus fluvialis]